MRVYYNEASGQILFTVELPPGTTGPEGTYLNIANQPLGALNAYQVVEGQLVRNNLGPYRAEAQRLLDRHMSELRTQLITELPGQDMIYLAKESEAKSYLAETAPNLLDYPLLSAEIGVTADTPYELAQIWLNMATMWRTAAAQLENLRLGTANSIEVATSVSQLITLMAGLGEQMNVNPNDIIPSVEEEIPPQPQGGVIGPQPEGPVIPEPEPEAPPVAPPIEPYQAPAELPEGGYWPESYEPA